MRVRECMRVIVDKRIERGCGGWGNRMIGIRIRDEDVLGLGCDKSRDERV